MNDRLTASRYIQEVVFYIQKHYSLTKDYSSIIRVGQKLLGNMKDEKAKAAINRVLASLV